MFLHTFWFYDSQKAKIKVGVMIRVPSRITHVVFLFAAAVRWPSRLYEASLTIVVRRWSGTIFSAQRVSTYLHHKEKLLLCIYWQDNANCSRVRIGGVMLTLRQKIFCGLLLPWQCPPPNSNQLIGLRLLVPNLQLIQLQLLSCATWRGMALGETCSAPPHV